MRRLFLFLFLFFSVVSVNAKVLTAQPKSPWTFAGINFGLGTSFTVGMTIARFEPKGRRLLVDLGGIALGPGLLMGRDDDPAVLVGLALNYSLVRLGKFLPLAQSKTSFGFALGFGGKFIWDVRSSGSADLYADVLPFSLFVRIKTVRGYIELGLRVPLLWFDGVYESDSDLIIYRGMPDLQFTISYF